MRAHTTQSLHVRFAPPQTGEGIFTGLASTFGNVDAHGTAFDQGAFARSLREHANGKTRPAMLWAHDPEQPIGVWKSVRETSAGLEVVGELNLGVARAREAYALLKQDALALSVGFDTMPGGFYTSQRVVHFTDVDLSEISLTPLPSNTAARVTEVRALPDTRTEFEHELRSRLGMSSRQAKRLLAGGWSALQAGNVQDQSETETRADELRAALVRICNTPLSR